mgnify:FL=1
MFVCSENLVIYDKARIFMRTQKSHWAPVKRMAAGPFKEGVETQWLSVAGAYLNNNLSGSAAQRSLILCFKTLRHYPDMAENLPRVLAPCFLNNAMLKFYNGVKFAPM